MNVAAREGKWPHIEAAAREYSSLNIITINIKFASYSPTLANTVGASLNGILFVEEKASGECKHWIIQPTLTGEEGGAGGAVWWCNDKLW